MAVAHAIGNKTMDLFYETLSVEGLVFCFWWTVRDSNPAVKLANARLQRDMPAIFVYFVDAEGFEPPTFAV